MDLDDKIVRDFHDDLRFKDNYECNAKSSNTLNFCQTCLSNNGNKTLKDMLKKNYHQSSVEIYSQMMDYCYSIQVLENLDEETANDFLICESCIERLREAVMFRLQIEEAQKTIKKWLDIQKKSQNFSNLDSDLQTSEESDTEGGFLSLIKKKRLFAPKNSTPKEKIRYKKIVIKNGYLRKRNVKPNTSKKKLHLSNKKQKHPKNLSKEISLDSETRPQNRESEPREYEKIYVNRKPAIGYFDLPYELERNQLQCKICNESFPTHTGLKIHMPRHFPNYTCEHCGRGFANRNQLRNHSLIHLPKKFECPKCPGMLFRTKSYRTDHMKKKHSSTRCFVKCQHCDARFLNYTTRQHHLVKVHGHEQRQYKCKLCEKVFTSAGSRSVHFRKTHLNKRDAKCDTCGKEFFEKRDLTMHMLIHTRIRNFTCTICGKAYLRQWALNVHMNVHSGEKKHVCEVCSKAFAHKSSLEGHMAVHEREWCQ